MPWETVGPETEPTPEELLAHWEELFAEFRNATPSAPNWYQLADYCIGVLMQDKIKSLKSALPFSAPGKEQ